MDGIEIMLAVLGILVLVVIIVMGAYWLMVVLFGGSDWLVRFERFMRRIGLF